MGLPGRMSLCQAVKTSAETSKKIGYKTIQFGVHINHRVEKTDCLIADQSQRWQSKDCMERFPYWCQFSPTRLEGTKRHSWSLADIAFSRIELWFTQKAEGGGKACNSNSKTAAGFSITWSTKADDGSSLNKVFKVPTILSSDAGDEGRVKKVFQFLN